MKSSKKNRLHFFSHFYYGWLSHLVSGLFVILVDSILIYPSYRGEPMPLYANATWNMIFRFPVWILVTIILTRMIVNRRFKEYSKTERTQLVVLNILLIWAIMFAVLITFSTFFTSQLFILAWGIVVLLLLFLVSSMLQHYLNIKG